MKLATKRKATGAHFTPPDLGLLVAEKLGRMMANMAGELRVLDPACGDGNLLQAMIAALPKEILERVKLIGMENDEASFKSLRSRSLGFDICRTELIKGDFLDAFDECSLFGPAQTLEPVDVIVANPPYVRTQVMGARRAQQLAARFGLSGRVDLYQAFLVAMSMQLRSGGILGVITSNRFLTTKGGMATRRFLRRHFDISEVVDLGDTKLFEAAVLPALIFAHKRHETTAPELHREPNFIRIYETIDKGGKNGIATRSVLDCVRIGESGRYCSNGVYYQVTAGKLPISEDDSRPWTMLTETEGRWISSVDGAASCRLGDVAQVRVGIKTTADDVFIRNDWNSLPVDRRPERRHLRSLLCQADAAKWQPRASKNPRSEVVYTHEVFQGKRRAIRFHEQSPTWKYLLDNRERLESRKYVTDAGRAWYELWVPQDPSAWSLPKIVFPDISLEPKFFLDRTASIVDGNCYWITTHDTHDEDLLLLILGVTNSALMNRYHDLAFQNKLYSQRRRHLTQYITQYPIPDREAEASQQLIRVVRRLTSESLVDDDVKRLSSEVDRLTFVAFGIDQCEIRDIGD